MRMNKSGTQAIPAGTDILITSWTADAAYPGTDILTNANKLTLKASDDLRTVTAAVVWTGGTNGFNKSCKLFKNGAQIGSTSSSTATTGTFSFSVPSTAVANGDIFDLRASASSTGFTVSVAGTFLQVV